MNYQQDPYMNRNVVKERLIKELEKYGSLIIAYDFDYTVHNYLNEGYSYEFVVDLIRKWRPYAAFIVFTASPESRFKYIKDYLNEHNIPFDKINEDILERDWTRKVYYNVLLDDRAGLNETAEILNEIYEMIQRKEIKFETNK